MNLQKTSNDISSLVSLVRSKSFPTYSEYITFTSRLKPYDILPSKIPQNKYLLADCGFIYRGVKYVVECFSCGLVLHDWKKDDIPWIEHSRHNLECIYVLLSKGNHFVEYYTHNFENFREAAKLFVGENMPLVTRKGVYPYEYTDSWAKLDVSCLPGEEEFYSTLTESGIKEEDFKHAKAVWNNFKCKTLGEYSDLYLKIHVLLLADVFENFRDVCMSTYNLDAAHYYTAPDLSFDAMLKYTGQKLELLSDYDMLLMFENGICGGLVQASMRYAKANNLKSPNYDETKEKSWLVYQDCNNLYGYAMSEYMPYDGLSELTPKSARGHVYEVDYHIRNTCTISIMISHFYHKIAHNKAQKCGNLWRHLSAIDNGLIVEKVHRVLEFSQSDWLAKYIQLNTEMKKKARNEFEKDFFKLMNNAIFGKTMQS
ncbi:hypothetical protein AGLY_008850 [Aphis glycines]|uniref:DNA-directed DNA polymerase n=1 Tax=Aphis glycines TaxID=307491 RepID=A0A6G0TL08_APHGL|nr:hypothetical protein AGLY_008850 [Aphis glycines]